MLTPLRVGALFAILILVVAQASGAAGAGSIRTPALTDTDPTCKPCDDFYRFAVGGWLAASPIPPTQTRWSTLDAMREQNRTVLRDLLENAARTPGDRAGDYYTACTDARARDAAGVSPIAPYLAGIAQIHDLATARLETAVLQDIGVTIFFRLGSRADPRDGGRGIVWIGQGGLGIADTAAYTALDAQSAQLREAYVAYVARLNELAGEDSAAAWADARWTMDIEIELARAARPLAERREDFAADHRLTLGEAQSLLPSWDLEALLRDRMAPRIDTLEVETPEVLRSVEIVLHTARIEALRAYLRSHLLERAAPVLSMAFGDAAFAFEAVQTGAREPAPLWNRCVRAVDGDLGDALGQLYVEHRFAPETRAAAKAMLDDLEATLRDVLWKSTWMSESTRREAVAKLDAISARVGYPEKWRTYSTVAIDRNAYATDAIRLALYRARHTFGGIARTQDHALWSMSAATINASYTAGSNEVTIPAGILQPPLFAPHGDDAANYGALGAIMGHELIHAFDDQGHRTDGSGLLRDWWQTSDERAFALHAACFEREYDRLGVIGNEHEDGALVVGEALADFGGARLAYRAFERAAAGKPRRIINGWTPEQRFFLAFARAHAALERPERARLDLADDPHATGRNRVIGTLSQMPEFAAAFHCAARAPMVTPPGERCSLF